MTRKRQLNRIKIAIASMERIAWEGAIPEMVPMPDFSRSKSFAPGMRK